MPQIFTLDSASICCRMGSSRKGSCTVYLARCVWHGAVFREGNFERER